MRAKPRMCGAPEAERRKCTTVSGLYDWKPNREIPKDDICEGKSNKPGLKYVGVHYQQQIKEQSTVIEKPEFVF